MSEPRESVVIHGKTYLTLAGLMAIAPDHPLLDRDILHVGPMTRNPVREEDPEMLIARWVA